MEKKKQKKTKEKEVCILTNNEDGVSQLSTSLFNDDHPYGISKTGKDRYLRIALSPGLREFVNNSDNFSNELNKNKILFAGCSVTAGESLDHEESWAKKLHTRISIDNSVGGYYNVAASGMSVTECIDQIFRYCSEYGNPKTVFLMLPDPWRDFKYAQDGCIDSLNTLIYRCYFYLEQYCYSNSIELITTTWYKDATLIGSEMLPEKKEKFYPGTKQLRADWGDQLNKNEVNILDELLKNFKSYNIYSEEKMIESIYSYDKAKKKQDKKYSLVASDEIHPGTSFHDFWSDFMYSKYVESK